MNPAEDAVSCITKLATTNAQQTYANIMSMYAAQGRGIVSFLYFANVMHWRLLEPMSDKAQTPQAKKYRQALATADFLLPDGIALQWFATSITRQTYHNLNGTDFIPYVLDQLVAEGKSIHVGICSVYDETIGKSADELDKAITYLRDCRGIADVYAHQDVYQERGSGFSLEAYAASCAASEAEVRILLLCTGTPHQEVRSVAHADALKRQGVLVFNAGGLVDYRSGFEERAPARVRKARVLETPWRILQHPQKNMKKLGRMFGIVRWWRGRCLSRISSPK